MISTLRNAHAVSPRSQVVSLLPDLRVFTSAAIGALMNVHASAYVSFQCFAYLICTTIVRVESRTKLPSRYSQVILVIT